MQVKVQKVDGIFHLTRICMASAEETMQTRRLAIPLLAIALAACTTQPVAEEGSEIKLRYTAKKSDGTIVDMNPESGPITFTIGAGKLQPAVEKELVGMKRGESRTITIENAYGEHHPGKTGTLERSVVPDDAKIGDELNMVNGLTTKIVQIFDTHVLLDLNHPLAGESITFELTIDDVKNADD